MSEMYWSNYYLFKDFSVIGEQLLDSDDPSMDLIALKSSYSSLAGRLRGGKGRNGLPVFEKERKEFEDEIFELEKMTLPSLPANELIQSPEWLEFTTQSHEAEINFDHLLDQIRVFLLEVAPSQKQTIEDNLSRIGKDNSRRDDMKDYIN